MLFLPVLDVWIANEPSIEQEFVSAESMEKGSTNLIDPADSKFKIIPYVLEGSVESFDPVARAEALSKTMPKKWCGTFSSFDKSTSSDVIMTFHEVQPIGQIVSLRGEMIIGNIQTDLHGNLNAKSDQLELLPLSNQLIPELNSGGVFLSLQGLEISGWRSTSLQNIGGRLEMSPECSSKISKSPAVRSLW